MDALEWPQACAPVPSLVRWGLSPDADLVYRALAAAGPRTGRWLAHDLGLAPRRVEAATEELLTVDAVRGAAVRPAGGRTEWGWRVVPVDGVVATLRRRHRRRPEPHNDVRRHHALIAGMVARGDDPDGRHIHVHTGAAAIRSRIATLVDAERIEHLVLNPERAFAPAVAAAALPLDRKQIERGIQVRNCGVPAPDGDRSSAAVLRLARPGGEYRERDDIPAKLMVFDRRVALLPADPLDLSAGAVEFDQPSVVAATVALFEQVWSTARDPRKGGVPPIVLTTREQAIVALLAEGQTDSVVARHLGISERTIAYTLRALMDRLGVENRFQLGLVLGAAHAATPPVTEPRTGEE
jgi:DNA-binding CsgD family transcriptional regulator